jgi:hypothetical protein
LFFTTRDTVMAETFARLAMSFKVAIVPNPSQRAPIYYPM